MALEFWQRGLERADMPGFSHERRWSTTSSLKKFLSDDISDFLQNHPSPNPMEDLPSSFHQWESLSQAQYFEIVTLLSPYLISSQGDRMLMAHSVEGRFPFLDTDIMDFCNSLPTEYKLAFLNEKHILKKVASGLIPDSIVQRKKQPYLPRMLQVFSIKMHLNIFKSCFRSASSSWVAFSIRRQFGAYTKSVFRNGTDSANPIYSAI